MGVGVPTVMGAGAGVTGAKVGAAPDKGADATGATGTADASVAPAAGAGADAVPAAVAGAVAGAG